MAATYPKLKAITAARKWPRWLRLTLRGLGILLLLQLLFGFAAIWYVNSHKQEVLAMVTEKLSENLNGDLLIADMEPTIFENFPRISLHLKNVTIRDTMYKIHQKTLLQARDFDIALNVLAFIKGAVEIHKISISNASVNLFTDANGYANSSVFKRNSQDGGERAINPDLKKFELENVNFTIDNQSKHKLFQFEVQRIKGNMDSKSNGWKASFSLETFVKSLAFSTLKGSFIKQQKIHGKFDIAYDAERKDIFVMPNTLDIGGEDFIISAEFKSTSDQSTDYAIHLVSKKILWRNASHLLTPNIYSRLDMFNLEDPISVRCDISGNFDETGDPLIIVNAQIKNNNLSTPGGLVSDCSFTGIFTNNNVNGEGLNDVNSAVKFENFKGKYSGMPFTIQHAAIINLENPIAKGDFKSQFELAQLSNLIDPKLLRFSKGTANVNLKFTADIVNYLLAKPLVTGTVAINDGSIEYAPRKLRFTKTSVLLDFKDDDLLVKNIHLQNGKSVINMDGKIRNFLNIYYSAPEKVLMDWKISSPEIHLSEFLKFLGKREISKTVKKKNSNADFTEELNTLFDKSRVNVELRVKKMIYNRFVATQVNADMLLTPSTISVKNGTLSNSGGVIQFGGVLFQKGKINNYKINASVRHVDVSRFFNAFDNFGLESMNYKNLNGALSAESNLTGKITDEGALVPNVMLGTVTFQLKDGALLNFDPILKIGKYAFSHRDVNNINFSELHGKFTLAGEKVTISPMQINSSVLNMDVDGIYSFGKGTNINVSVPLRNPDRDKDITDADELAKRRERGVVIRLNAADGDDGKVKLKLVSKKTQLLNRQDQNE